MTAIVMSGVENDEGCVHRLGRGQQPPPRQLAAHHPETVAQCASPHHRVGLRASRYQKCGSEWREKSVWGLYGTERGRVLVTVS